MRRVLRPESQPARRAPQTESRPARRAPQTEFRPARQALQTESRPARQVPPPEFQPVRRGDRFFKRNLDRCDGFFKRNGDRRDRRFISDHRRLRHFGCSRRRLGKIKQIGGRFAVAVVRKLVLFALLAAAQKRAAVVVFAVLVGHHGDILVHQPGQIALLDRRFLVGIALIGRRFRCVCGKIREGKHVVKRLLRLFFNLLLYRGAFCRGRFLGLGIGAVRRSLFGGEVLDKIVNCAGKRLRVFAGTHRIRDRRMRLRSGFWRRLRRGLHRRLRPGCAFGFFGFIVGLIQFIQALRSVWCQIHHILLSALRFGNITECLFPKRPRSYS